MNNKISILALFLAVVTLIPCVLAGCSEKNADPAPKGMISVGVQNGKGYTVEGPGLTRIRSGESAAFTIIPDPGRKIVGFSHGDYTVNKDEYVFKNVRYPCLIEVYLDVVPSGGTEISVPVTEPSTETSATGRDPVTDTSITAGTGPVSDPDTSTPIVTPPVTAPEPVTDTAAPVTLTNAPTTAQTSTTVPDTGVESTTKAVTTKAQTTKAQTTKAQTTSVEPVIEPDKEFPVNDPAYANSIIYVFNGGVYKGKEGTGDMTVFPDTSHHKRVNTVNDTEILYRSGHTLIGWNTKADGSGEHVGLGGRTTLNKNGALVLYAQWSEWSAAEDFTYKISSGKATVKSYAGNDEVISVPETLGGAKVTAISSGAFKNLDARAVVFPTSMQTVDASAFSNCKNLTDLYMFDTVTSVSDSAFDKCDNFSTLHINALKAPAYMTGIGKTDAYDSLILSDKKCIVFFAGSSCLYGIDAYRAREYFNGEYDVINLGWTAPRTAIYQLLIIDALLEEGDIFVHAPEYLGSYQLLRSVVMGTTAWQMLDSNLDLFSLADIREMTKVFSSFCAFTKGKDSLKKYSYDNYCKTMDDLGYMCTDRPVIHDAKWAPSGSIAVNGSLITDIAASRLTKLYDSMESKGVTVYLTYPPLNINYLDEKSKDPAVRQTYTDRLRSLGRAVLGELDDSLYSGDMFHDTEFHLVTVGTQMHTDRVVSLLIGQMQKDGIWGTE